jgi:uncharacterized protein YqjF (DUF2071 family)
MTERKRRGFLTAQWRYLVMLNYDVDPAILYALVPRNTELDLWNGRAIVSAVGFRFLRTCVLGVPVPLHRDFEEVNLRFYVRHTTPDGDVRRGVVFVRELVPRLAIALAARVVYNEPYRAVRMRSSAPTGHSEEPGRVSYGWRTGAWWQEVAATATGAASLPSPVSEEKPSSPSISGDTHVSVHRGGIGGDGVSAAPRRCVSDRAAHTAGGAARLGRRVRI